MSPSPAENVEFLHFKLFLRKTVQNIASPHLERQPYETQPCQVKYLMFTFFTY